MTIKTQRKVEAIKKLIAEGMAPTAASKKMGLGWHAHVKYIGTKTPKTVRKRRTAVGTLTTIPTTTTTTTTGRLMVFVGDATEVTKAVRELL